MPLINGMKMACEPCIRGHRSTKCTHANERLMVPVKKPGRPLSACPHLHNQLCGCSSVTAAIPRKQKCHCGTGAPGGPPLAVQPRPAVSTISDIPSPTKVTFRVQKPPSSSRPGSRKQSYDLSNLVRMDLSSINIAPYQDIASQSALGQDVRNGLFASMTYVQYANDIQDPQPSFGIQTPLFQSHYSESHDQPYHSKGTYTAPGGESTTINGSPIQYETAGASSVTDIAPSIGASCCATKTEISSDTMGFGAQLQNRIGSGGGDSSTETQTYSGFPSTTTGSTPETSGSNGHSEPKQSIDYSITRDPFKTYLPQTTAYTFPASYGSYQHPLQPWEWRSMSNMYALPIPQSQISGVPTLSSDTFPIRDTFHTCGCGDTCQCIGCVAHPYNDATQKYIRSAYNMVLEPATSATTSYTKGHNKCNIFSSTGDTSAIRTDGKARRDSKGEDHSLPFAETPSDANAADEQALPSSDFFFVSYPFTSDGCGGDTNSCPCGDECQCIGCAIHHFGESTVGLPSEAWASENPSMNGDSLDAISSTLIKDEGEDSGNIGTPVQSCCA